MFNSLISNLIAGLNLSDQIDNDKNNQDNQNDENIDNKSQENEKKADKSKKEENQDMSIENGMPDIDTSLESDKEEQEHVNIKMQSSKENQSAYVP